MLCIFGGMTPTEALKEIISEPKWYTVWYTDKDGNLKRDAKKEAILRVQALRILNGTAHHAAMKSFFERFGKEVEIVIKNK